MNHYFETDILTIKLYHLIVAILLFGIMILYLKIAEKYKLSYIRGGGIIFWFAGIIFSIIYLPQSIFFLIGFTLICGVGFWKDISPLPIAIRLIIQLIAVGVVIFDFSTYFSFSWWLTLVFCGCCVGTINMFSLMDEISRGMTGLYSLVILGCLQYVNQNIVTFTHPDFIIYGILACLIFLFFNYRRPVICSAGNIGSAGIAFWIVILLLQLILTTHNFVWISFLAVYGIDTICTMIYRLCLKYLKFGKLHSSRNWVRKTEYPHLLLPAIYAMIQLIICVININLGNKISITILASTQLGLLVAIYVLKFQYDSDNIK